MDWQKVISSLEANAQERLQFSKRANNRDMRVAASTECGILDAIAKALRAGLERPVRPAFTLSKPVMGAAGENRAGGIFETRELPAGTIVYQANDVGEQVIEGQVMIEVTLNPDGSGLTFFVEASTLYRYTAPTVAA